MNLTDFGAHIRRLNPEAYELWTATSRSQFEDRVEALIDRHIQGMQEGRSTYRRLNEPGLCFVLRRELSSLVHVEAEPHSNGHVDLKLQHPDQPAWTYLVEAKIWGATDWHRSGMLQLLHYATGREGRAMVLAFFIRHKRMTFLLGRLRRELDTEAGLPATTGPCRDHVLGSQAFESVHEHQSGATLVITHLGCDLYEDGAESDDALAVGAAAEQLSG